MTEKSMMNSWTTTTKTYTASSSSHRREEQCPQAPGAKRLLLRPGGGPERLCGPAPQEREVCADPEKLRGLQGDRERAAISDERPGGGRGGGGSGRKNS